MGGTWGAAGAAAGAAAAGGGGGRGAGAAGAAAPSIFGGRPERTPFIVAWPAITRP